jgi:hypothetical protein
MRIRFFKPLGPNDRFAWLPRRLMNGTIVWLEPYSIIPVKKAKP